MGILKMRKIFSLKESLNKNMQSAQNTHRLSDEELLALQKKLMESYQDIYEVCKKYQIKPIIEGGSLLGYVRHNGFIPWDDDLDFAMSREDYEKFKKIFHKELSDRYILSVPNGGNVTVNRFMQIYVKNTRLVTADMSKNQPKHIAIDIFPIDFVPQNAIIRCIKGLYCNTIMAIAGCVQFRENKEINWKLLRNSMGGRLNYYIRICIGGVFSWKSLKKWFEITDRVIRHKRKTGYITSATGRKHYLGEITTFNDIFPVHKATFAGAEVFVPNLPERYLANLYGDYMQIPDPSHRESHFIVEMKL